MEVFEKIINLLKENKIGFEVLEHDFVHTSKDAAKTRGNTIQQAAKALILKTKSEKYFMLIVPGNMKAKLKTVKQLVGEKNVSLASPEEVLKVTGLKVGSVAPFGQLFNLDTYFEKELLKQEKIVFSAGSHYKSIKMKPSDLLRITTAKKESFCETK